jgi:hypothetical protein
MVEIPYRGSRVVSETGLTFRITEYQNATMHPVYLSNVRAWHGHVPFAFFITELLQPKLFVELGVHAGDSYCAFCQGLGEAKFAKAFGIDTFEGDEHSGSYSPKVYEDLKQINESLFPFSTLLKERFETAVEKFQDGSIGLLHVDGCHTYEAVSRDVEMWRPKLAKDGIVLFHDTQAVFEGFGVHKFWKELKQDKIPCFDFYHSSGLGMAILGESPHELLTELCQQNSYSEGEWVRNYFELLAERIHAVRNARNGPN